MEFNKLLHRKPEGSWFRGFHYHLTFGNGYREYGWSASKLKRKDAIDQLISFANFDDTNFDWDENGNKIFPYDRNVIDNYWVTKSDTR